MFFNLIEKSSKKTRGKCKIKSQEQNFETVLPKKSEKCAKKHERKMTKNL